MLLAPPSEPSRAEWTPHTVMTDLTMDTPAAPLCGAHVPNNTDTVDIYVPCAGEPHWGHLRAWRHTR